MSSEKITEQDVTTVLKVVDKGLSYGMGTRKAGFMCVEAAVCYAFGEPHSDMPSCVEESIRDLKININDRQWSSKKARAKGMRRIAVAQLGSLNVNGGQWLDTFRDYCVKDLPKECMKILSKYDFNVNSKTLKDSLVSVFKDYDNGYFSDTLCTILESLPFTLAGQNISYHTIKELRKKITKKDEDEFLTAVCEMAVKACKKHKTQGSKFLYLCDEQ